MQGDSNPTALSMRTETVDQQSPGQKKRQNSKMQISASNNNNKTMPHQMCLKSQLPAIVLVEIKPASQQANKASHIKRRESAQPTGQSNSRLERLKRFPSGAGYLARRR